MGDCRAIARAGCRCTNWLAFGDESGETGKGESEKQGQER
jgi:hypothetical protein